MKEKDTIRNYKDNIFLDFVERGDSFSLNVPHFKKWTAIIRFLRKRGFKIGENPSYKEHYASLSKYHKIGSKGDVRILMEIQSARIELTFGHVKNLWTGIAQSFWSRGDDRHEKLTYLQYKAVELEIKRLMDFCMKWGIEHIPEREGMRPTEYILDSNRNNPHVHGKIECLDDIRKSINEDSYNWQHNSTDKNKVQIVCGQTKYFYDYRTKRLSRGVVWHNINNMWWVIVNDVLLNIACFELFDYDPSLPKRGVRSPKDRIESALKKAEAARDYKKCMSIQAAITKLYPNTETIQTVEA